MSNTTGFQLSLERAVELKETIKLKIQTLNAAIADFEEKVDIEKDFLAELENFISSIQTPQKSIGQSEPKTSAKVFTKNSPIVKRHIPGVSYPTDAGWASKAKYILSKNKRSLTLNEILTIAGEDYEPELLNDVVGNKSNLAGQLKTNLGKLFERFKQKEDVKYYYYGLKEWFNEDGECKEEYLPE